MKEQETFNKTYIQFVEAIIKSDGLELFESFLRLELSLYAISNELLHRRDIVFILDLGEKKMESIFTAYANDIIKFKEGYKPLSKMEAIAGFFHLKYKRELGDEAYKKKHSDFFEKMPKELIKLIESIDITDKNSLEQVRLYCRFASNWFVKIPLQEEPFGMFPMLTFYNEVWIKLSATANQLIGYWKAKLERRKASMIGGEATATAKEERIKKLFDFLKQTGSPAEDGIEIDRSDWETFFTNELEIYTDKTKREYKKLIEKQLKKESGKDLKIKI
jgi:hypothetical protein